MKLKNSTDFSDWCLRRMVGWCCRQLGMPTTKLKLATFRNSRSSWGGCARYWSGKITVCVGKAEHFPTAGYLHGNGHQNVIKDREECLVWVTAHEAAHVYQDGTRTRSQGGGGSEIATEWHATPVLEAFRKERDALLARWNEPPVLALRPPSPTLMEARKLKVIADLARWTRKLKLAQTKVKKLNQKVRRYSKP